MIENKIVIAFGTRPEVIKVAPIIKFFEAKGQRDKLIVLNTGQHSDIIGEFVDFFDFKIDYELQVLLKGQSLNQLLIKCLSQLQEFKSVCETKGMRISGMLAQGDTLSVLSIGMFSFLEQIPFFHLEAGLRSFDLKQPFPEEFNRKCATVCAALHYAPTLQSVNNLIDEKISAETILYTGNTIVDALDIVCKKLPVEKHKSNVLITCHRRENQNEKIANLENAVFELCNSHKHLNFLWIKHPNPKMRALLHDDLFAGCSNFKYSEPLGYFELIDILRNSAIAITDSGGIQEEAPSFQVPVLVLREKTERPESVLAGVSKLVGLDKDLILKAFDTMLHGTVFPEVSPYGDGKASDRVYHSLLTYLD